MIELLMVVCFASSPHHCKDEKLVFAEAGLTVYTCAMRGQIEIAKWANSHPNWRVHGYKCGKLGQVARI
jgi:hypothetical protein